MATRRALGARGHQVLSQLLTESLTLAIPSCLLGIAIAFGLHRALLALAPSYLPRLHDVRLDLPVLLFAVVVSLLAGIVFGLAPVVYTFSLNLVQQMTGGSGGGAGLGQRPPWQSRVLVVGQLALAAGLVFVATLMTRSFLNLESVDPGFRLEAVGGARVYLDDKLYRDDGLEEVYFRTLLERLRSRGDVLSAGASSGLPLDPTTIDYDLPYTLPEEEPVPGDVKQAFFRTITPGYLETMGIPLLAGRTFDETDRATTEPVALVNETFARLAWSGRDAVGQRFQIYDGRRELLIVGVVGDVHFSGPAAPHKPEFYLPHPQAAYGAMTVVARGADGDAAAKAIAEEALAIDPRQPIHSRFSLEGLASAAISTERFLTLLLAAFAAAALALSSAGIYGVISYWVQNSRRELGLRMALGASGGDILRRVLLRGLSMTALGLVLGVGGSLLLARFLSHFLFGVDVTDAASLLSVVSLLALTATAASLVPGLRASGLDPMSSLRMD
jgi:putative ABC transport system permease protein